MMRRIVAATLAVVGVLGAGVARADYVPMVKGNDTGGIISYNLVGHADVKAIAADHWPSVPKKAAHKADEARK